MNDGAQQPTADGGDGLRVGIVGLGMIGGGVAVSLARKGRVPAVYDVRPNVSDDLVGVPAQVATLAELARDTDIILVAVVTADQAREVIDREAGILSAARPGATVVLLSTVDIQTVRELAAACARRSVGFLDAGVTGGTEAANNGLTVMVGGPEETMRRTRPVLEDFAKLVVHCGDLGAGMVTKLARNALTYSMWAAVREAASLANAGGVTLDHLLEVLRQTDGGTSPLTLLQVHAAGVEIPEERIESADALAQKDLAAAQEFAGSVGLEVPIVDIVRPRMRAVYSGELPDALPDQPRDRGLAMMDRVYGGGFSQLVPQDTTIPSIEHTVDQLFAQVWARPYLTLRDRRLLTFGVTAMRDRGDMLRVQLTGALANHEFTVDQLREIVVHLHYYTGWPAGSTVQGVFEELIAKTAS
ncbi:NAD(P)-binding domain-containing protein [Nocardia macrotermitis]|uniref:2-hydroxy-3-oxopropionate reductase n=1 Tax=Nocardia macrotermitis TaxID=2585198 RepID=A0A7K0D5D9_9NOCA|nr:NAD(P)-binding domain-containing protein [Nocardia macrotermitis]MQY20965.1 2-hydroxy-3-oxopropionate reductase [Nocardia macrotermitis]